MKYLKLSIEASEEQQEILISKLEDFNIVGFEQMEEQLIAYFEEGKFNSEEVTGLVKSYQFFWETVPQQNWNAVWESNFEPVVVDDFCAIRAEFHAPIKGVQHEIIITPKMSFGTGHHETTYMMINAMRDINFAGKTVFDFGTGTGILAILASKLRAASITAIDVDEWSITNAKENFQKNDVTEISLYHSSVIPQETFDVILANINRNVLIEYSSTLVNTLSEKGILLISGLLKEDEKIIVESFSALQLKYTKQKGNWMAFLFHR
jgi:ribosomal protein L11 methyltransferase